MPETNAVIGVNLDKKVGGALTMASTEHEPITGVWGAAPSGVQGQRPWSWGEGAKLPEAESFSENRISKGRANWLYVHK